MRRRKKKNLWLWLLPILVIGGGIGGYAYYQNGLNSAEIENTEPTIQTATVRNGEIIISATGAGTIIPATSTDIGFMTSGTLTELNIKVGDRVAVGDVLARLENSDLQKAIADAELAVAQVALQLDDDGIARAIELAEIQVRLAELTLEAQHANLNELLAWAPDSAPVSVASAELNLTNAKNNLAKVVNNASGNNLDLQQAQLNVQVAQNNLSKVQNSANNSGLDIQSAQLNLNQAQASLNTLRAEGPDAGATDIASAGLNVSAAQRALDELINWTPDWDEIRGLQANFQAAQQNLANAQTQNGLSDENVVAVNISLQQSKESLADAQAAYDSAFEPAREWETLSHDCKQANAAGECQQTFSEAMANERENAERNLERAKQNLQIAQAQYDIAIANSGNSSAVASAQSSVINAETALKNAQVGPDENDIQAARDSLYQAQLNTQQIRDNLADGTSNFQNSVTTAEGQVQQAQLSLQVQQANAAASNSSRDLDQRGAQLSLQQSQLSLESLRQNSGSTYNTDRITAEIQVSQAELALREARESVNDDAGVIAQEIATARRSVEQANLSLRQAQINLLATGDTSQSELSLRQAELNLENTIAKAEDALLISPVAGTVTALSAQLGASVSTASIVSISDLGQIVVEIFIDETDIDKVAGGNTVELIFDALPETTFNGQVTIVDPQLVVDGGVTTVRALVELEEDLFNSGTLTAGMNATVEIIGGRATNTLIVPIEALRELSPGNFSVFVMEEGEPRLRPVEVGLRDFAFAEITGGLTQGDVVTTGLVETQ